MEDGRKNAFFFFKFLLRYKSKLFQTRQKAFKTNYVISMGSPLLWLVAKSLFPVKKHDFNYVVPRANILFYSYNESQRFRWSRSSVLAFGTQVSGFTPG
jgi:hypothetical protein